MKRSIFSLVALLASVLLFSGCQREGANGQLTLVAEGMNHGGKMAVDGYSAAWATGDPVRINDEVVSVSVDGGNATVSSATTFKAPFYGVYPSGIYADNSGANYYTLELPNHYVYAVCGDGRQNLHSPMVAYSESGSTLTFKHLTAAIGVQVVNYYGFTIAVDSIVVSSDSYRLNGSVSLTLNGSDPVVEPATSSDAAERLVKMTFGSTPLQVFAGDSTVVQVPVLPVGAGNKFSVKICVHKVDQPAVAKAIEKTQTVGGALGRSYLAYARLATPGLFSVAANKKVIISQGNLQYQASTGTWKFSETQYGSIGNAAGNNVFDDTRSTQSAWIDLFGWGTSGWNNGNTYYQPYDWQCVNNPTKGDGYGPCVSVNYQMISKYSLTGDYINADWGVRNSILNGGNMAGKWRVLTGGAGADTSEWVYLVNTRSASTINGTTNARFARATVAGVPGVIVFPDSYIHPEGVSLPSVTATGWAANNYSESDWVKIEAQGAVFMPVTGYRSVSTSNTASYNTNYGYYWSSKWASNQSAYYMSFGSYSVSNSSGNKRNGYSVRLVRDIN